MNILLLGNGFDLYHKLPTTYLSFLKVAEYLKNHGDLPIVIYQVFSELTEQCHEIRQSFDAYSDFYNGYFFDENDKKELKKLVIIIKQNLWFDYFLKSFNVDVGWIDFEKEINSVLKYYIDINKQCTLSGQTFYLKTGLQIPMKNVFFDKGIYSPLKDKYVLKKEGLYEISINKEKIFICLFESLKEFSEALKIYLKIFVDKPFKKMATKELININPIFNKFNNIVTFNYTTSFEQLYSKKRIYHIHGNINDNIVLGINPNENDEIDNLDTSYIMFKKYYQRILYRTDTDFYSDFNCYKISTHCDNLVVCGHSLDLTDKDIFMNLFEISNKIYIVYHNPNKIGDYVKNLISVYGKERFDQIRSEKNLQFITYYELENIYFEDYSSIMVSVN